MTKCFASFSLILYFIWSSFCGGYEFSKTWNKCTKFLIKAKPRGGTCKTGLTIIVPTKSGIKVSHTDADELRLWQTNNFVSFSHSRSTLYAWIQTIYMQTLHRFFVSFRLFICCYCCCSPLLSHAVYQI